jgi:hypothetical protein
MRRNSLLFLVFDGVQNVSAARVVVEMIRSSPHLVRMSLNLGWMYLTLGRRVRKTRRAFERELRKQSMSQENAERLSFCFEELKRNIIRMLKQGIRFW